MTTSTSACCLNFKVAIDIHSSMWSIRKFSALKISTLTSKASSSLIAMTGYLFSILIKKYTPYQ